MSSNGAPDIGKAFSGLLDVRVPLEIVLGTGFLTVRECLALRRNSVVRLAESAGCDLNVVGSGVVLAVGEVVIVEDSTAVRVTEIKGALLDGVEGE